MKKVILLFVFSIFLLSCSQEYDTIIDKKENSRNFITLSLKDAQQAFAKILSKAVYSNREVRLFLQNEALIQFDNDYDIFYPFAKNKIVNENKTFRDILLTYCNDENELVQIEESLYLLNILIPDLSWIGGFSVKNWDASNNEVGVICRDDETNTLYENGQSIGHLALNEIPDFPCLVVKNNERLRVKNAATRSGEATYEFISDIFDSKKNIPNTRSEEYMDFEEPDFQNSYLERSQFDPIILEMWKALKDRPDLCERDYIYYGIGPNTPKGTLNPNIRETLYAFRINPAAYFSITDQDGSDPKLQVVEQKKEIPSRKETLKNIWTDGKFEFIFSCHIGTNNNASVSKQELVFNLDPRLVFSIDKIKLVYRHSTLFRHSKYTLTADPNDLKARWVRTEKLPNFPNNGIQFAPWDLYNQSLSINIYIQERDDNQTIKKKVSSTYTYTNKSSFEISASGKENEITTVKKSGFEHAQTTTSTKEEEIITSVGSDNLGSIHLYFYDPVISDGSMGKYGLFGMHTASNGTVEAIILPKRIKK